MASEKISQLPVVSSSSGADIYPLVQAGATSAITFANLQSSILAAAAAAAYTPAHAGNWQSPPPTTIQEALDRIAAVVGNSVPIP